MLENLSYRDFKENISSIKIAVNKKIQDSDLFLKNLYNANAQSIDSEEKLYKINRFLEYLPSFLSEDELLSSINLNLKFNFDNLQIPLPENFNISESKTAIHMGNLNQLCVYYSGIAESENRRIACLSLYFLNRNKKRELRLNNLQGEIKPTRGGYFFNKKRKIHRVFGKLNSFYGKDWRIGLIENIKSFGEREGMKVIGEMPGIFYYISSSISEYPLYSLYYLNSFLKAGISLENIDFRKVPNEFEDTWNNFKSSLMQKENKEKFSFLDYLTREYRQFYSNQKSFLYSDKSKYEDFEISEKKCVDKFYELFN